MLLKSRPEYVRDGFFVVFIWHFRSNRLSFRKYSKKYIFIMEKILVPTDFSQHAENALQLAIRIAKNSNAQIELVHVVEVAINPQIASIGDMGIIPLPETEEHSENLMKVAKEKLNAMVANHASDFVTIHPVAVFDLEKGYTGVNRVLAHYTGVNLIVMGSKGTSGTGEIFVGSNTEFVVKYANVPVFVAKEKLSTKHELSIVYPTSFENLSAKLVKTMMKYVNELRGHLHLLYINTAVDFQSDKQIREMYAKFIVDHNFGKHTFDVNSAFSEEEGIVDYVSQSKADMIIMPTHGRTGLASLFSGSITKDVVNHSHVSVLTFNMSNY